jgi:outer membrane protein
MKTKKIIMSVMMLTATMTVGAQKQWTLNECIDYALKNNISLKKKTLTTKSAIEDVKQAKAALLPSLSASTNHSFGYRPWTESGQVTVSNGTVNSKVSKTYYNGSYGINASWTVWDWMQKYNTVKLNKLSTQEALLDSATTANNIQEEIAKLYVQILYLDDAIKVNEESLKASQKNEDRGRQMVEVGKMSKADLAQLTSQRATDEFNLVEAKSNLSKYKLQLKQLLEITDEQFDIAIPATTEAMAMETIPTLNSIYEAALMSRPEIERNKMLIENSDLSISIAKAQRLPSISLSGSVGTNTSSMSNNDWSTQMKTNFSAAAGFTVSVPIIDNRRTKTAVNKAKLQREQYELDLQEQQKKLYSTIEGYWLDAHNNQQKFVASKASTESAQESYNLLSEQFDLGLKNIVELMNGKVSLLKAQQNQLQSKYMAILDMQLLKFYGGSKSISDK